MAVWNVMNYLAYRPSFGTVPGVELFRLQTFHSLVQASGRCGDRFDELVALAVRQRRRWALVFSYGKSQIRFHGGASCPQFGCAKFNLEDKNVSRRRELPDWMHGIASAIRWTIWTTVELRAELRVEICAELREKVRRFLGLPRAWKLRY
jgi:hypothetical protein